MNRPRKSRRRAPLAPDPVMREIIRGALRAAFYLGVMLPLWSSYLVRVYAWKLLLAKEGVVNWVFAETGMSWLQQALLAVPVIGGPSRFFATGTVT